MNEDPIQRQLRQQQEEITKLRGQLSELEHLKGTLDPYKVAERETLLSALEELRRSSWDAVRSSSRFSAEELPGAAAKLDEYPALVTLTPDPMLSGKLKYGIVKKEGLAPFRIGRAPRMDLELDGIGICQEHCEVNDPRQPQTPLSRFRWPRARGYSPSSPSPLNPSDRRRSSGCRAWTRRVSE